MNVILSCVRYFISKLFALDNDILLLLLLRWSLEFTDFVSKCLVKNPENRATATQLLQHEFICGADSGAILGEFVFKRPNAFVGRRNLTTLEGSLNRSSQTRITN